MRLVGRHQATELFGSIAELRLLPGLNLRRGLHCSVRASLLARGDFVLAAQQPEDVVGDDDELLAVGVRAVARSQDPGHVAIGGRYLELVQLLVEGACVGVGVRQLELTPLMLGQCLLLHRLASSVRVSRHGRALGGWLVLLDGVPATTLQVISSLVGKFRGFQEQQAHKGNRSENMMLNRRITTPAWALCAL
ncbi:hypothetical protein D3C76_450930 [compost metagenome]